ncbi:PAS domain S-box protein [Pseudoxanthomonas sp. UTMC 1351]|uniref:PAS domain S-box protein n=1 Tax=Pseudoxanthomonas sp. UTMC 1351 TaxID=2695853 RepID=UPI0034CD96C3
MTLAAEAAGLGLWNWDVESDDFWFTSQSSGLPGFSSANKHIGREHVITHIHPDDLEVVRKARETAVNGTGVFFSEFRLLRPNGGLRWLKAKGEVKYEQDGVAKCLHGVIYDVTEQRQAEERFRLVVDGARTAMIMADANGNITLANLQAEKVFGYNREELLGHSIDMLLPKGIYASSVRMRVVESHSAGLMGVAGDVFGRRKDGAPVPLEIGFTPLWMSGDTFVLASIADISERLRSEQEIALQRDEVAHLARVAILGEISGSLAHELNQPLTSILSNAQAALRFLGRSPPNIDEVRDSLIQIVDSDKRASEVIRRLRAMLRKEKVDYQRLELNSIVREVVRLLDSDLLNRKISVVLELCSSLPPIYGDRVQLQQVLLNLIVNGCDAMRDIKAERVLRISTKSLDDSSITVSVRDLGHGVPADDLERIFMPFVTSKPEGIALGLAICATIIWTHRGKLWATNNQESGATFHFQLPVDITHNTR